MDDNPTYREIVLSQLTEQEARMSARRPDCRPAAADRPDLRAADA